MTKGGIIRDKDGNILNGRKKGSLNKKGRKDWCSLSTTISPEMDEFLESLKGEKNKNHVVDTALRLFQKAYAREKTKKTKGKR